MFLGFIGIGFLGFVISNLTVIGMICGMLAGMILGKIIGKKVLTERSNKPFETQVFKLFLLKIRSVLKWNKEIVFLK